MGDKNTKGNRLNNWVSFNFKLGIVVCLTLVVIGIILIVITGVKDTGPVISIDQIPQGILNLDPIAIITLGILTLLITPIMQIVVAAVTFSTDRDKLYLGVSVALLCTLILSFILALI